MGSIYRSGDLTVSASVAWDFVDRYTRSEVHAFTNCVSERQVDDFRVVVTADGMEIWERNVTVDPEHMRAVYAIPGLMGAEHHQAEMRVVDEGGGRAGLVWTTDFLPHELAEQLAPIYDELFADLVAAVNNHQMAATNQR
jgi:hypothetical protein